MNNYVIIVNQFLGPLSDLINELISSGLKVILISGETIDVKSNDLIIFQGPRYNRKNIYTRFNSWVRFSLFSFNTIRKLNKQSLILFTTNPPFLPWLGMYFKLIRNQQYLVRILDIYPDVLIWAGIMSKNNPINNIWVKLNSHSYERAGKVICLGRFMAEKINFIFHAGKNMKMVVVPDWANTEYLKPIPKKNNPFVKKYSLLQGITIMYSGNMGITHDLSMLINLAESLTGDNRFQFVIVGEGPNKDSLKNESTKRNLNNILFLPYQDINNFNYSMASADISVISLSKGSEKNMMPCKTYSGMAVGSAIFGISQPPNDVEYIINKYKCGFNVVPDDINSALEMLNILADNPELLIEYKRNSRRNVEKYFSSSVNTRKIIDIIKKGNNRNFHNNKILVDK